MTFKYFSGFCLENEKELFFEYLQENDFTLAGFSYGAIKAFEEALSSKKRIDTLQLISPAFFQNKDKKFKKLQLMYFKKDKESYFKNFLENISLPSSFIMDKYFKEGSYEELEELLNYEWQEEKLQCLVQRGVKIEVYLASEDKIIDSSLALDFFRQYSTVYYLKDVGHILK